MKFKDLIKTNETLNPVFWQDDKLNPTIRKSLMKIADKFMEFLKVKAKPVDIIFTGSMANFNWTSKSDIDLHIVYNFDDINDDTELVTEFMLAKKKDWNDTYTITVKGFPVELYGQNEKEPHYSHGIYSVMNDKWNVKPTKEKLPDINDEEVEHKVEAMTKDVDDAIRSKDLPALSAFTKKLKVYRSAGLERGGEYSIENLVFKTLRNNGVLEKIGNAKTAFMNKDLSLDEAKAENDANERLKNQKFIASLQDFVNFTKKYLKLKKDVPIKFIARKIPGGTYGYFQPDEEKIVVHTGTRALGDIFRTAAHELVHRKQDEEGKPIDGRTGSPIENEANKIAGIIMRVYGEKHPEIYK